MTAAKARRAAVAFGEADHRWMRRALALARRGRATTRPNPMVGAVIVRGGRRLAEGFHRRPGGPHAEVAALARVGGRAPGATLYVTLEPCNHTGRTPPCTEALIAAGVARVVVGVRDANPLVDGRGIARLRRAGIRVDVGCLEDDCRALNRAFFAWVRTRRPLVTLKVAASWDGFIADGRPRARAAPAWLTGAAARAAAHALRAQHHAILVGAGTIRADDPLLTVRGAGRAPGAAVSTTSSHSSSPGPSPGFLRVILDGRLAISARARALAPDAASGARTLVIGAVGAPASRARALRAAGADVALLRGRAGRVALGDVLAALGARDVQSLLVEGGADVHGAFIAAGLVDRVAFFLAPLLLGGGVPIAAGPGRGVGDALPLGPPRVRRVGADLLVESDVLPRR